MGYYLNIQQINSLKQNSFYGKINYRYYGKINYRKLIIDINELLANKVRQNFRDNKHINLFIIMMLLFDKIILTGVQIWKLRDILLVVFMSVVCTSFSTTFSSEWNSN